jgi:hypothetical protein
VAGFLVAGALAVQKAGRSVRLMVLTRAGGRKAATAPEATPGSPGSPGSRERVNTLDL